MTNDLKKAGHAVDSFVSRAVQNLVTPASPKVARWSQSVAELRGVRMKTLEAINGLSQEQADYVPAPGKWSIAQNADHILLSERFYRTQITKLIAMAREGRQTTLELTFADVNPSFSILPPTILAALSAPLAIMNMLVPSAVRETVIRFPLISAIAPTVMQPQSTREAGELRLELSASIDSTGQLFAGAVPALDAMVASHPLLGRNTVGQLLGLMSAHEQRHLDQINGIRALPSFPQHAK